MSHGFTSINVTNGSITVPKLATGVLNAGKNKIINGNMMVWQRGTAGTNVGQVYMADRFSLVKLGTNGSALATNWSQETTIVPTVSQAGTYLPYSQKTNNTSTYSSTIASNDLLALQHIVEGYNFAPLYQKSFTLSFWFYTTAIGQTFSIGFRTGGGSCYTTTFSPTASQWQRWVVTCPACPADGTAFGNSIGVIINWSFFANATVGTGLWATSALNSWTTSNDFIANTQTNGVTAANSFYLTGVQLEEGSTATELESILYPTLLQQCQRYYWSSGVGSVYNEKVNNPSTGTLFLTTVFPVPMRTPPTGVYGITAGNFGTYPGSSSTWFLFIQGSATTLSSGSITIAPQATVATYSQLAITGATWSNTPSLLQCGSGITFLTASAEY